MNLESQEYWILNNLVFQNFHVWRNTELFRLFSRLGITQNNSVILRKLQKQDDSGKIEILILILSVFLFYSNELSIF